VAHEAGIEATSCNLRPIRSLSGHFGKVYAMAWSKNSKQICTAAQDGKLIIWNAFASAKNLVISLRTNWVMTCGYSASGTQVASGGLDNIVTIHQLPEGLGNLANSKNGNTALGSASVTAELAGHQGYVSSCSFTDPEHVLTTSGDGVCALFNIATQNLLQEFRGHDSDVMDHAVSPDNPHVFISSSVDTTVRLWDTRAGGAAQGIFVGHEADVNSVCYLPNGTSFATGSDDCSARLFDTRAYSQFGVYSDSKQLTGITSVAVSRSSRLLFSGTDSNALWVWDTQTCQPVQIVDDAHENRICGVATSPDGMVLATCSFDYSTKIWA